MKPEVYCQEDALRANIVRSYERSRLRRLESATPRILRNVVFDPKVGLLQDGRLITSSFVVAQKGERLGEALKSGRVTVDAEARKNLTADSGKYYYLGVADRCWGHCLLDCTRFLWPVISGLVPKGTLLVYSAPGVRGESLDLLPNFRELLKCAGIDERDLLRIDEPTRFESIGFAEESMSYDDSEPWDRHCFTEAAKATFDAVCRTVAGERKVEAYRTVYLSRMSWRSNAMEYGEANVIRALRRYSGCEVISPQDLSFREMVRLLQETKTLITTEGSLAHNAVFLQDGAEIVLLMKAKAYNFYQPMVNELRNLKVTYVDINGSDLLYDRESAYLGPFYLSVTESLAAYLGCRAERSPLTWLNYAFHAICRRLYKKIRI